MEFNRLQLAAISKIGKVMALADGKLQTEELTTISIGLGEFGIHGNDLDIVLSLGDAMEASTMLAILSAMNTEQKKFVCGFLSTIMSCDGNIDDAELKIWRMTSTLAGFPIMSIGEANKYWSTH